MSNKKLAVQQQQREKAIINRIQAMVSQSAAGAVDMFNLCQSDPGAPGFVSESFLSFLNELGADLAVLKMKVQDKRRAIDQAIRDAPEMASK